MNRRDVPFGNGFAEPPERLYNVLRVAEKAVTDPGLVSFLYQGDRGLNKSSNALRVQSKREGMRYLGYWQWV
jgi:hypothetical protein